ncbi:MAG TPA: tetratricopeptide repeat protein [Chitinophagaceae bacterium]|nr:tetratricopeptide repeat protein [Chitinophagaceae bacterium]
MTAPGQHFRVSKLIFLFIFFFSNGASPFAQRAKADSLARLLTTEKEDTNRVTLMWRWASAASLYNPDTALVLSFQALSLAKKINYTEGESRATGILANTFMRIGNYPRALELNIEKLKIEEKRNNSHNLASVLMNIGIVYVLQEQYANALEYYAKADSVIRRYNVEKLKYNIALNIGDAHDRLDNSDSAFVYYSRSLEIAKSGGDPDNIGISMTGLGHTYRKLDDHRNSLLYYQAGILYLQAAQDDEILCEAALGLAKLFENGRQYDSAGYYANLSLTIAKKDGFLSKELEAAEFLTDHYKKVKDIDSAFTYVTYVRGLNDSVNSKDKIRESQVISSNEQLRQLELEEERDIKKKERFQQLQMLLIAIFIPGIFLVTIILSRINVHIKLIRLLGVLSLLFLFEYLTLLLHPTVAKLTNHTPVYEILIFVAFAALLIPAHHRLEHWMIHKLLHNRSQHKAIAEVNAETAPAK